VREDESGDSEYGVTGVKVKMTVSDEACKVLWRVHSWRYLCSKQIWVNSISAE